MPAYVSPDFSLKTSTVTIIWIVAHNQPKGEVLQQDRCMREAVLF